MVYAQIEHSIGFGFAFGKVLSLKSRALFDQLDRRVQLMIDLQLVSSIPMIEP